MDNDPRQRLGASEQQRINALADDFVNGPARFFLKTVNESECTRRKQQLKELIRDTYSLSVDLWKRPDPVEIRGFKDYKHLPFRHDSPVIEADRSHRMDGKDDSRDGERIRMVVHPGFFSLENEDKGESVWAKVAVILPAAEKKSGRIQ